MIMDSSSAVSRENLSINGKNLFVGDLSSVCTEADLVNEFCKYGTVEEAHILRKGSASMGYGFVTMSNIAEAINAAASLDGVLICGRRLKVRDAEHGRRGSQHVERYSVHFKFAALEKGKTTDEVKLRTLFLRYGEIIDISIRKKFFDRRSGLQKGFGFLKFANDNAANKLISEIPNFISDEIQYFIESSSGNDKNSDESTATKQLTLPESPKSLTDSSSLTSYEVLDQLYDGKSRVVSNSQFIIEDAGSVSSESFNSGNFRGLSNDFPSNSPPFSLYSANQQFSQRAEPSARVASGSQQRTNFRDGYDQQQRRYVPSNPSGRGQNAIPHISPNAYYEDVSNSRYQGIQRGLHASQNRPAMVANAGDYPSRYEKLQPNHPVYSDRSVSYQHAQTRNGSGYTYSSRDAHSDYPPNVFSTYDRSQELAAGGRASERFRANDEHFGRAFMRHGVSEEHNHVFSHQSHNNPSPPQEFESSTDFLNSLLRGTSLSGQYQASDRHPVRDRQPVQRALPNVSQEFSAEDLGYIYDCGREL